MKYDFDSFLKRLGENETSEALIFRFGLGCLESRCGPAKKEISELETIKEAILSGHAIDRDLLGRLFPEVFRGIRSMNQENPWAFENVLKFCQDHNGVVPGCSSYTRKVVSIKYEGILLSVRLNYQCVQVSNPCGLRVNVGDKAFFHKRILYHVVKD